MNWNPYLATKYLSYQEIEKFLQLTATTFPQWVNLEIIGNTQSGIAIYLLTIGKQDTEINNRPAIWLDGGTHAAEWTGVMATLYIVSSWLDSIAKGDSSVIEQFNRSSAYILPCISPDGYEELFNGGAFLRSNTNVTQNKNTRSGFEPQDIDGDGIVRWMRWKHPAGSFVIDENQSLLMRPRTLDDSADDAYFFCEEGIFLNWNNVSWNSASLKYGIDLNRNFPGQWQPFSMFGTNSGRYTMSEIEAEVTVKEFAKRANICAALTHHTHTGCILTQPFCKNTPLSENDIQFMHTLATDLVSHTNYKVYKVFPEFTYSNEKSVSGVWSDTMSTVFGIPGYTIEFWNPYDHAGFDVDNPVANLLSPDSKLMSNVFYWYAKNYPELTSSWKEINHPQLGKVEIGGFDTLKCIFNPPEKILHQECDKGLKFANKLLRCLPVIDCKVNVDSIGNNYFKIQVILSNNGYLSTSPLQYGENLVVTPDVNCRIELSTNLNCLSDKLQQSLPHLQGWANQFSGIGKNPIFSRLKAKSHCYAVEWIVKGKGNLTVHWQAGRAGSGSQTVKIN